MLNNAYQRLSFLVLILLTIELSDVKAHLNYNDYYNYPQQRSANTYDYPQTRSRIGTAQPPYGTVYWPAAMLNSQGQSTGDLIESRPQYDDQASANFINDLTYALMNAITSALFPRNQQQQRQSNQGQFNGLGNSFPDSASLPLINLIPSASIHLGPSQQYGYGTNTGVYAGIQSSNTGYNYNYNNNNGQPINRPYGPANSNVGGSYGGLSQWSFQPQNGQSSSSSSVVASTMSRPNPTQPSNTQSSEAPSFGTVRTLSLRDLLNEPTTRIGK